jgi:hypothetical protein
MQRSENVEAMRSLGEASWTGQAWLPYHPNIQPDIFHLLSIFFLSSGTNGL